MVGISQGRSSQNGRSTSGTELLTTWQVCLRDGVAQSMVGVSQGRSCSQHGRSISGTEQLTTW